MAIGPLTYVTDHQIQLGLKIGDKNKYHKLSPQIIAT